MQQRTGMQPRSVAEQFFTRKTRQAMRIHVPNIARTELTKRASGVLMPAYLRSHPDCPVTLERGSMQYVYDSDTNEYLDAWSGVVTISAGHCHPEILELWMRAGREMQHCTTLYYNMWPVLAAEALCATVPQQGFNPRVFWVNSGGEANELAAQTARLHTKRTGVISFHESFHGRVGTAMAMTAQGVWRNVPPYTADVHHAPVPRVFHRPEGMTEDVYLSWLLDRIQDTIENSVGPKNLAAFFMEPIQGNGGLNSAPSWFYTEIVNMVHSYGGLVVADEVQTGVYRTGDSWWACQQWEEMPDMITAAKGLGNGVPVGVVIARENVAEAYRNHAHFNTFGSNPPTMAQVYGTLQVVGRPETRRNIQAQSRRLLQGLRALKERHPMIGDVRGRGLMLGVELVIPKSNKEPASRETLKILDFCREGKVLLGKGGVKGNVVRIKPPYCLTDQDVADIVTTLSKALTKVEKTL